MSPSTFVFSALTCEAKPLIQHWRLKKTHEKHPFMLYADAEHVVVITGVGGVAMAGAVAYVLALFPDRQYPLLLNLGIAGHVWHSVGALFLAHKIVNTESGKKFYPQLPFMVDCETATVATVAKPQIGYPDDCLYDMEAAAFYEIAGKFSSSELIHSLKIVSDNAQSPLENITEPVVEQWVTLQLEKINAVIADLIDFRRRLPVIDDELCTQLLAKFPFTATSAIRLRKLLQNWQIKTGNSELNWLEADAKNAKQLLAWLEEQLEKTEFYL